ncbi:alpha-1,4-glucan branching enzyme [Puccinia graminis f. sp. tritici]|uniref:Alpha-1,4-glucan branching enzyme n=1 Tax=Puccinia graminis f. sp. tritici TaxID=56615 RepID=A0A5B0LI12_PUCGR|nr:alpha-1,4-glucan branching enzyme [Puccinia graminis f. sp. tritici]
MIRCYGIKYLNNFDAAMNNLESQHKWLSSSHTFVSLKHESDRVVAFERGKLLFIFNFHPTQSYTDYRIGVEWEGKYQVVLSSDEKQRFGGHDRVDLQSEYFTTKMEWNNRKNYVQVYLPSRMVLVLGLKA